MKYKIIFSVLLITIIFIGIKGVDITEFFFDDNFTEETVVPRDSVNTRAIYIASPNEISFHPMEAVENAAVVSQSNHSASICLALVKYMSEYSEDTTFSSSVSTGMRESFISTDNGFYYLQKFAYYNPANEIRYVDCIITHYDYMIVYIRFYSDEEYQLNSDDINEGLENFRISSEKYYSDLPDHLEKLDELLSSYGLENSAMDISYLDSCYSSFSATFAETYSSKYFSSNDIEYFWDRSIIPCKIYFWDEYDASDDFKDNYYNEYGEEYAVERYENSAYSSGYILEAILDYSNDTYSHTTEMLDSIEYVAYNGRIYQTIKFDPGYYYMNSIIVIYNIKNNSIEGFYAPPNTM